VREGVSGRLAWDLGHGEGQGEDASVRSASRRRFAPAGLAFERNVSGIFSCFRVINRRSWGSRSRS